jgi:hypothetical protein
MSLELNQLFGSLCSSSRYINSSEHDWFPELDELTKERNARKVCHRCPVQFECAQAGLSGREAWGIWGGMEEFRVRRALGKDSFGSPRARTIDLVCPYCNSNDLEIAKKRTSKGYRVECNSCSIEWITYRIPEKVRKAALKADDNMGRIMGDGRKNNRSR